VFLAVALAVLALIHGYLYRRLAHDVTTDRRTRRAAALGLALLAALVPAALVGGRVAPWPVERALAWVGYLWLALAFYLMVALLAVELPRLAALLVARRTTLARRSAVAARPVAVAAGTASHDAPEPAKAEDPGPVDPGRRLLVGRSLAIMAGLVATGTVGAGTATALGPPRLRRVDIPVPRLRRDLDGLRIALVSDIHLGPILGRGHTERVVAAVNGLGPDLVAVVGDLVDGSVGQLGPAAEPLRHVRSRLGAFFVTGNHEYFSGYGPWVREVAALGLRPLRNERLDVGGLTLAGVNDATGAMVGDPADYARALDGRDPDLPTVLLAHQPIQVREAARRGVEVQLSGHTHGGQMWPFHYVVRAQQGALAGLSRFGPTELFVTRGVGFWGPPVRVGAPPEVVLVRLRAVTAHPG
jgi:predicted MPP superfamily phosphohydrolase